MPVDLNLLKVGLTLQTVSISCWHTREIREKLVFQYFLAQDPATDSGSKWGLIKHRARTRSAERFLIRYFQLLSFWTVKCLHLAHPLGTIYWLFRMICSGASSKDLSWPENLGHFLLNKQFILGLLCEVNSSRFLVVGLEKTYSGGRKKYHQHQNKTQPATTKQWSQKPKS